MRRRDFFEERRLKRLISIFTVTLVLSVIVFSIIFIMYNKKMKEQSNNTLLELGKLNAIVPNEEEVETKETSSTQDKTIEDSLKNTNTTNTTKDATKNTVKKTPVKSTIENTTTNTTTNVEENKTNENVVENQTAKPREMSFCAPVSGEIIKDFAVDTLVYSNTLEEWTTHSGIDIKAEKTTVVTSAESGCVESIKNDPRYGLTITITHDNGFKTVYSNLLTTEFVKEGDNVEKGQTIATIGESSSFEIADEAHLHFEMYKDGASVNPTIYLKDM